MNTHSLSHNKNLWIAVSDSIASMIHCAFSITEVVSVSGGDISDAFAVTGNESKRYFVKINSKQNFPIFEAEKEGLAQLGENVPSCITIGVHKNYSFLALDYLSLTPHGDDFKMGECLAQQHKRQRLDKEGRAVYGWEKDNFIGTSLQINDWNNHWGEFWIQNRMLPQINLAKKNGYAKELDAIEERFLQACKKLLGNHTPKSALLHGDLWRGNAGFVKGEPIFYDPACYFGDRETDLALTELFGGFSDDFYRGYNATWPIEKDYKNRKVLYNLYHLLNHLNLFGRGYLQQVTRSMQHILEL